MTAAGPIGGWRCRRRRLSAAGMLLAVGAGAEATAETQAGQPQVWTTRTEHRIDEPGGSDTGFGQFSRVRVGGTGDQIVIFDRGASGTLSVWKVLVCSPEGSCVPSIGPDEVPADLGPPWRVRAGATGFRLRFDSRLLRFSYDNRTPIGNVAVPTGMERFTLLDNGRFVGLGGFPAWNYEGDNEPPSERAVFSVADTGGEWKRDTIAVLNIRHSGWFVAVRGESSRYNSQVLLQQPFADHDLTWIDAEAGSMGIVRRNGGPGMAEVFEISATGDTVWHRQFSLPKVPLTRESAGKAIEDGVADLRSTGESHGLTTPQLRSIVEEALHLPGHVPPVLAVVVTASGEVWLKTPEVNDGLAVWYSVPRGEGVIPARRILLPSTFQLQDAYGDHVWGFSEEPSHPRRVLGLRPVPPSP